MKALYEDIIDNLIEGDIGEVTRLTQKAIDDGNDPQQIIDEALVEGMNEVSILFSEGEMFVPEVLVASKAMNAGMDLVKPLLKGELNTIGKAVFATVKGDLHDIGKKLVAMMMESAGFEIINLGTDVSPEVIVEAVKEYDANIIGMSAMLTTTMVSMKDTVEALKESGLYDKVKIMIGGAPVTEKYAEEIGVYYSNDATEAVNIGKQLMGA